MKMLNAEQVAKILSCSESTIRNLAAKGKLGFRCLKIGAMWRFPEEDVMKYVYGDKWDYPTVEAKVEDTGNSTPCAE